MYKVNSKGYIMRYYLHIIVRGDLQDNQIILSMYTITLALRSFRIAMALAAKFNLKIYQYNVINAFINAEQSPTGV